MSNVVTGLNYVMQHSSDKDKYFDGVLSTQEAMELIFVDVLEGFNVFIVSSPLHPFQSGTSGIKNGCCHCLTLQWSISTIMVLF